MPFNGGGSSSGVTNHNHTNLPNEGGALNNSTLLNASTLVSTPFPPLDHLTNSQANEGGALMADNSIVTGSSIEISGTEYPIEVLL